MTPIELIQSKRQGEVYVVDNVDEMKALIEAFQQVYEGNWRVYKRRIRQKGQDDCGDSPV